MHLRWREDCSDLGVDIIVVGFDLQLEVFEDVEKARLWEACSNRRIVHFSRFQELDERLARPPCSDLYA